MKLLDDFTKEVISKLCMPMTVTEIPHYSLRKAEKKIEFPMHCQKRPVLNIIRQDGTFFLRFHILNCKLLGQYGITADEELVQSSVIELSGKNPSPEPFCRDVMERISWLYNDTCNTSEVPEERKFDALQDILSKLSQEALCRDYWIDTIGMGNHHSRVRFEICKGQEAVLEVKFSPAYEYWSVDFKITEGKENIAMVCGIYDDFGGKTEIPFMIDHYLKRMYAR